MTYQEKKRWLLFGLPLTFTKYTLTEEQIIINTGFLNQEENYERENRKTENRKIKDFIIENSEDQRMKRRTINTLNISAEADSSDLDGDFN